MVFRFLQKSMVMVYGAWPGGLKSFVLIFLLQDSPVHSCPLEKRAASTPRENVGYVMFLYVTSTIADSNT